MPRIYLHELVPQSRQIVYEHANYFPSLPASRVTESFEWAPRFTPVRKGKGRKGLEHVTCIVNFNLTLACSF